MDVLVKFVSLLVPFTSKRVILIGCLYSYKWKTLRMVCILLSLFECITSKSAISGRYLYVFIRLSMKQHCE